MSSAAELVWVLPVGKIKLHAVKHTAQYHHLTWCGQYVMKEVRAGTAPKCKECETTLRKQERRHSGKPKAGRHQAAA